MPELLGEVANKEVSSSDMIGHRIDTNADTP